MSRKPKKSYAGVIVTVAAVVLVGVSAFLNRDWISKKLHRTSEATAAAQAAETNQPPPPPPELTVDEIWPKVGGAYKGLTNLSVGGKFVSVIDYTQVNRALAANGPRTTTADVTLKMSRPDYFRLDDVQQAGTSNITSIGWSAGKGDFIEVNTRRSKMPDQYPVFSKLDKPGAAFIAELFFNQADVPPVSATQVWTRNPDETINGQPCYVLVGTLYTHNALVWISRNTFLVSQVQIALDGKVADDSVLDEAKLKAALAASGLAPTVTGADVTQLKVNLRSQSKLKGTMTETYTEIKPNVTIAMSEFEPTAPVASTPAAPSQGGAQPPGRGLGGSGPNGVAGRLRRGGGG